MLLRIGEDAGTMPRRMELLDVDGRRMGVRSFCSVLCCRARRPRPVTHTRRSTHLVHLQYTFRTPSVPLQYTFRVL